MVPGLMSGVLWRKGQGARQRVKESMRRIRRSLARGYDAIFVPPHDQDRKGVLAEEAPDRTGHGGCSVSDLSACDLKIKGIGVLPDHRRMGVKHDLNVGVRLIGSAVGHGF